MPVTVRYFAAAAAAAGVDEEQVDSGSLAQLIERIGARHGQQMVTVLPACSFLVDGRSTTDTATPVSDGGSLDILPPFAGG